MHIIGITGPTGAGKTTAMRAMQRLGALTLDCDDIYHEVLEANGDLKAELIAGFGDITMPSENNPLDITIDRRKLGTLVWGDPDALERLNNITHKYVLAEVLRRIKIYEQQDKKMVAICAIALIESDFAQRCDTVICITAPADVRISRLVKRDGLPRKDILTRIQAQKPDSFFIENSDYVIKNTFENPEDFEEACMNTIKIDTWFSDHKDELISDLKKLVAIDSVRGSAEPGAPFGRKPREALKLGQEMLEKRGFDVNAFEDMVITADFGPKPAVLGILTHLDIVETGKHWDTDPLVLTEKDGRLYGRGVMDNKGPAVATMYALYCVRDLFPELKKGVRLIFGSSEETGFEDIARYIASCSASCGKNDMPPNVFSPDADFPVVNLEKGRYMQAFGAKWEKDTTLPRIISVTGGKTPNIVPNMAEAVIEGVTLDDTINCCKEFSEKTGVTISAADRGDDRVLITAKGTASHASRPDMGNNAQTALLGMLAAMPFAQSTGFGYVRTLARLFPHGDYHGNGISLAAEDGLSGKTTVNFGVLRFDEYEFSAGFDARTAVCADDNDLPGTARSIFEREGIDVSYYELKRSHHTPEKTQFVQTLLQVYERCTGRPGYCMSMGGLTYVHDIPGGVAFGAGMPDNKDDNNVHGANEYIETEQLLLCAKIFTQAIIEICNI